MKYQAIDWDRLSADEKIMWRALYDEAREMAQRTPKLGAMKLSSRPDENRYAVAVRESDVLYLALWIRISPKGEVFIMLPRGRGLWNPHASYHADGTFHQKSHDKAWSQRKLQPLAGFKGAEHLGAYAGYSVKAVGAICVPADYTQVLEIEKGVLGPRDGSIVIDLVEPGLKPLAVSPMKVIHERTFSEREPNLIVRVCVSPTL